MSVGVEWACFACCRPRVVAPGPDDKFPSVPRCCLSSGSSRMFPLLGACCAGVTCGAHPLPLFFLSYSLLVVLTHPGTGDGGLCHTHTPRRRGTGALKTPTAIASCPKLAEETRMSAGEAR